MFNKKEEIIDKGQYRIIKGKTFDETKFQYKDTLRTYTFRGKSICNLVKLFPNNTYQLILNTGTEIIITEQFYNEVEELML